MNLKQAIALIFLFLVFGCQSSKNQMKYRFKKKWIAKCLLDHMDEFNKIQEVYFSSIDSSEEIHINPYIVSDEDKCVGLFRCTLWEKSDKKRTQISTGRPILIFKNKVFTFSKLPEKTQKILTEFRNMHSNEFSEIDLHVIEKHFSLGKFIFPLH